MIYDMCILTDYPANRFTKKIQDYKWYLCKIILIMLSSEQFDMLCNVEFKINDKYMHPLLLDKYCYCEYNW